MIVPGNHDGLSPWKSTKIRKPTDTILVADVTCDNAAYAGCGFRAINNRGAGAGKTRVVGKHNGIENYVFADGHAEGINKDVIHNWLDGALAVPLVLEELTR